MVLTGFYAGVLALIYVVLTFNVIGRRMRYKAGRGDAGHEDLARAVRVHGNFIEYTPIALILIGVLDSQGLAPAWIHAMGLTFVAARILHIYAITKGNIGIRKTGMVMTVGVIALAAILCIMRFVL